MERIAARGLGQWATADHGAVPRRLYHGWSNRRI